MRFSTVLAFVAASLTLAVVAALLPFPEEHVGDPTSFFNVAYSFPTTHIDNSGFSLPEFILPIRQITNLKQESTTVNIAKIRRPLIPHVGQLVVKLKQQSELTSVEQKFGSVSAPVDPIAEFLKNGPSGFGTDSGKSFALEVDGRDNMTTIRVVDSSDLANPDEELRKMLASSPRLTQVKQVSFEEKPENLQIYDILQPGTDQYSGMKNSLLAKCNAGNCNVEELKAAGFLLMNEGKYSAAREMYGQIDSRSLLGSDILEIGGDGDDGVTFEISGRVLDNRGRSIRSAIVKSLDGSVQTTTDRNGNYSVIFPEVFDLYKIRLNASKPGYSTATIPLDLISSAGLTYRIISGMNFTLENPVKSVTLNNQTREVDGEGVSIEGDNFIITTEWSRYEIPFNALVRPDGTQFSGEVETYLFEFDKDSDIGQLLVNDIFDEVADYAGNIMKTFGMPFILFIDENGNNIHVLKSNPMILRNKISEMEALRTNEDQIYEPLTDADLIFLKTKSDELGGYPINRELLIDNNIVRFPAFWVYDQLKGVWENIGTKLVSTDGEIETVFYTYNDVD